MKITTIALTLLLLTSCYHEPTKYNPDGTKMTDYDEIISQRKSLDENLIQSQKSQTSGYIHSSEKTETDFLPNLLGIYNYKDIHHFAIKIVCDHQFVHLNIRNADIEWIIPGITKGTSQTDDSGILRFSFTNRNAASFDSIELKVRDKWYKTTPRAQDWMLVIPQAECTTKK